VLEGIQGATGNWSASFWIADTSAEACALQSSVRLDLVDRSGQVRLTATKPVSTIDLSARSPFPPTNPPAGRLAFVALLWPTDGSFPTGTCPTPDFVPDAVRIVFSDGKPITVTHLRANGRQVAICGSHIGVLDVGPLGP